MMEDENKNEFFESQNMNYDISGELELPNNEQKKSSVNVSQNANNNNNNNNNNQSFGFLNLLGSENDSIQGQFAKEIAGQVYTKGRDRARTICDLYAHIDFIRPYFDVEPKEVAYRLFRSIIPEFSKPKLELEEIEELQNVEEIQSFLPKKKADLYGPLMLSFTLSSILLLGLKFQRDSMGTHLQQGTLLSTALFVVFSFWIFISVLYYFLSFIFNSSLSLLEVFSASGYSQFGICLSLLVTLITHNFVGSTFDFAILFVIGGLSAFSLAVKFFVTTPKRGNAAIFAAVTLLFQFCFVVYLKVFYVALSKVELDKWKN